MKRFLSWIGRMIYKRNEYIYLFSLPVGIDDQEQKREDIKKEVSKYLADDLGKGLRVEMIRLIAKDLSPKTIDFTDFYTDTELGLTYFIFGSYKNNPFFVPLFYEIFANIKRKKLEKFSYSNKKLIFKNIEVLKFTVKCYGKR